MGRRSKIEMMSLIAYECPDLLSHRELARYPSTRIRRGESLGLAKRFRKG